MRLHNVLDDLFACGSKVKILRLMFKHEAKEFTEREIASMIGMSPNTVNLAILDLRKTNILKFKRIGRTNVVSVNKNSVLYPFLKDLYRKEITLIKDIFEQISGSLPRGDTAIIFGSFARGTEEYDSDLDLLVISKKKTKTEDAVYELLDSLLGSHSLVISPIIMGRAEFEKKKKMPYIKNALKEGKVVCGAV